MAQLPKAFSSQGEQLGDYKAIDGGTYVAHIIKSEMKDTKNKGGKYLQLTFKILEGDHVGRQIFARLNLVNANIQTTEIAEKAMNSICAAAGIENLEDSEQLHNIPMLIDVVKRDAAGGYAEQNDIKNYHAYDGAAIVPASPVAEKAAAPSKTPPWKK